MPLSKMLGLDKISGFLPSKTAGVDAAMIDTLATFAQQVFLPSKTAGVDAAFTQAQLVLQIAQFLPSKTAGVDAAAPS